MVNEDQKKIFFYFFNIGCKEKKQNRYILIVQEACIKTLIALSFVQ